MLRKSFCAGVALLLAVSVTLSADTAAKKAGEKPHFAFGKVVTVDVKDGVGTLTIMGSKAKGEEPKEMKFAVTKDTKFTKGGGPGKQGDPVEAAHVSDTFHKDGFVFILFTGEGANMTATMVNAVAFKGPGPKGPGSK